MFKIGTDFLEEIQLQLMSNNALIHLLKQGKKIHPKQVEDLLDENKKLVEKININYLKPE